MKSMRVDGWRCDDEMVQLLGDGGALIFDGVLGHAVASDTFDSIMNLAQNGTLRNAGVGRLGNHRQDESIRQDLITWVDENTTETFQRVTTLFEDVRIAANQHCWLGAKRFDTQIALYNGNGAHYDRHRDAFAGKSNRVLTAIYYPNVFWQPDHGGRLRVFFADDKIQEIDPIADRLVIFLSERLDHQVLPAYAARAALTAWFYS